MFPLFSPPIMACPKFNVTMECPDNATGKSGPEIMRSCKNQTWKTFFLPQKYYSPRFKFELNASLIDGILNVLPFDLAS